MNKRMPLRERDLYWATLGTLLVLVIIADVLLISHQYNELRQIQRANAVAEINFVSALVEEALSNEQYHLVEILVQEWGEKNPETTYLAVETPEGYVLARYTSDLPTAAPELIVREVNYRYQRSVRIKLETDMAAALGATRRFGFQVLAGSSVLLALFGQMLLLFDRSRRQRVLEAWAHQDGLTGVANRRRFERALHVEWGRARRLQSPLALIMADVDAFKAYNDRLGHPAGDQCLRQIAAAMAEQVSRPADMVARYGGEEFAVILPDTDLVSARQLAERMRQAVEHLQMTHPSSEHSNYVTISVGVAAMVPMGEQPAAELVARADRALYSAKAAGGNCSAAAPATATMRNVAQQT